MKQGSVPGILLRAVYMTVFYMLTGICVSSAAAMISMEYYQAHPMLWTFLSACITIPFCLIQMKNEGYLAGEGLRKVKQCSVWEWVLLIILSISSCIALNYWIAMSGLMGIFQGFDEVAETIYRGSLFEEFLAVILAAPIAEELLFRGLAYRGFRKLWNQRTAMLVSALFFGIYHRNVVQGLYAFLIGILLIYVYEAFATILAPIVFHMAANAVSVLMTECLDMSWLTENWIAELVFAGFFTVTGIFAFLLLQRTRTARC